MNTRLQSIVATITFQLSSLEGERLDNAVAESLNSLGAAVGVDRCGIVALRDEGRTAVRLFNWQSESEPSPSAPPEFPTSLTPMLFGEINNGRECVIQRASDLPEEWSREREVLERDGIVSFVGVPIVIDKRVYGSAAYGWKQEHRCSEEEVTLLRIIGQAVGTALARGQANQELRRRISLEELSTQVVASLGHASDADLETALRRSMKRVAMALAVDHIWVFVRENAYYGARWTWRRDDDDSSDISFEQTEMPFWSSQIQSGKIYAQSARDDLPRSAAAERAFCARLGVEAVLHVPLQCNETVSGFVGVASRRARDWSEEEGRLISLIASVLARALYQADMQVALRESEERYRSFIAGSSEGVFCYEYDPPISSDLPLDVQVEAVLKGTLVDCNERFAWLVQRSKQELLGTKTTALAPIFPAVFDWARTFAAESFSLENAEVLFPRGDDLLHLLVRTNPVSRADGLVRCWGVVRDVTEQKRVEGQLLHAQKLDSIGVLAGGIAHDFNNLLTAILVQARTALETVRQDPAEASTCLQDVLATAERAAGLTRQLLAFSRQQVIERRPVDPNLLIGELYKMLRRLIPESIDLDLSLGRDIGMVFADPGQIEQVIVNLCVNARDAISGSGRILIETRKTYLEGATMRYHPDATPGHYIVVAVSDSGSGMPPEVAERAFEPFFTTKLEERGTGLGLSTVYGIVKQHEGRVTLSSEVGEGTLVEAYLPAYIGRIEDPLVEAPPPQRARGETILVAEDDNLVRNVVVRLLRREGYSVVVADDGEEALRIFRDSPERFDLVFLDAVMPKVSGRDAYQEMVTLRPKTRFLFSTGYTGGVFDEEFLTNREHTILRKPYDPGELLHTLRNILDATG